MGLFDLFKSKPKGKDGEATTKKSNAAAKYAEAAASKRAQAYDRQEALHELVKLKSADAAEALLRRFTFAVDPSITDQEEKDLAFEGVVAAGKDAIEPVRAFAAKAESVAWPMRILKELVDEEGFVDELLVWLAKWDTDYAKFIDPKLQILDSLGDYKNPKIRPAVAPFLEDVDDRARFNAVVAVLKQEEPEGLDPLINCLLEEESVRIKAKIADGIAQLGWEIPDERRDAVRKVLPYEFGIDGSGRITKRG